MTEPIQAAAAAAQRGDWAECLALVVTAWRPRREPELAALIDRVAQRVYAPSMEPSTKAIAARVAVATVSDVGAILATIRRQLRNQPRLLDQLVALASQIGPEPRIAQLLAEIFEATPFARGSCTSELPVLDALVAIDDPRFRATITQVAASLAQQRDRSRSARVEQIAVAAAAQPKTSPRPYPHSVAAIVAELAHRNPVDLTPLLAAIYADPDATEARLVYADALQERGDPRGEFIALQCANATPSRRERAVLRIHEREWLGGIDPHVRKGVIFRRGFVASATLAGNFVTAPTDPAWHTLEEIDMGFCSGDPLPRWLATLRGLRRVAGVYTTDFLELLKHAPMPRWRCFGMRYATRELGVRFAKHHAAMFPALDELDLSACTRDFSNILNGMAGGDFKKLRLRLSITLPEHVKLAIGLGFRELEIVPIYQFQPTVPTKVVIVNQRITQAEPELLARISTLLPARVRSSWK